MTYEPADTNSSLRSGCEGCLLLVLAAVLLLACGVAAAAYRGLRAPAAAAPQSAPRP
ncbi:MAG: hypothetical protein JOZ02_13210 [Acidobacteria bacterium]|nr:hypothetical protein [Acidobacteriota bacterium]